MKTNQWHPGTLLELSGSYWKTCALHAAVKLDLFTVLSDRSLSAPEVAAEAALKEDAAARLLNALAAMGLLIKDSDRYVITPAAGQFLSKASDDYLGHMIMHHHYLMASWGRLDQAIANGGPLRESAVTGDEETREAFLMGMYTIARLAAPGIVETLDLTGRRRLFDMGGGPGTFAVFFCRAHPSLSATVFDMPATRPFAESVISRYAMQDRVRFEGGNYVSDALSGRYDAVWMSHVLHGEDREIGEKMLADAYRILDPGGLVAVHEFILDNDGAGPLFPALFSLNMLLGTDGGRSYTEAELSAMLTRAGFENVTRLDYVGPTQSGIMTATKPH